MTNRRSFSFSWLLSGPYNLLAAACSDLAHRPAANVAPLDVLRSLAILLVFSGHFAESFGADGWVNRFPAVYFGWTGVDLFFVLSGLLIGIQLWKELKRTGRIKVPVFLLRRGLRIWPLYYALVAFILFESLVFHRELSGFWADLTFLSNYFHNQIGGGWSLSTEEQFYVLTPLSLLLLSRILPLRRMWVFPVTVLLCLPAIRALMISAYGAAAARQRMYFPIYTHSDGLAIGILLAWTAVIHPQFLNTAIARKLIPQVGAIAAVAVYLWNRNIFNYTSLALIYGAMTLWALTVRQPKGLLNWQGFYIISRLSYGIYLNQFGLLPRIGPWLRPLKGAGTLGLLAGFLVAFAGCALFAFVTFLLIERPFLALRDHWLASRATAKPPVPLEKAPAYFTAAHK